ncbi:MmgE/PrpD family protein [Cryobacterium tepidiphilum]|uniref:MmgE/PrpD family protein n=1 Tax=Cryobacterium tepidiphilum TaxID=2486026 RepID=A0A3M8L2Y7_9MICO|nr:MmgE/PrpD family protein [Cryobacterium tepidiphilum]RNE59269.1 MmgE/PrpD family protein [Cryobacterium tepidiphilum]
MRDGATAQLAGFAARLRFDDLPDAVVEHAKLCLLDTIGCGLFGSTLPWVEILRETIAAVDDGRRARLWGSGGAASVPNAALINGTAVHAFELDDLHPRSILHPGAVVVSAAMAAAAHTGSRSGRDLVTALVAGYEVGSRVGMSMGAAHLSQGWHPTGTHGTLAAAAGAGSMLGLGDDQMLHALGTAGSQSSGLMSAQFSSMVKRLNAGHAAQSGVTAALLAEHGFLGIPDLLENSYGGYLSTFSPSSDIALVTEGLGEDWQVLRVGFKPYSTNGSCHPAIDALLAMEAEHGITAADVDRVEIDCSTATFKHVGWPYEPVSVTSAQMNLPYIVAVVLADGDAFIDQFSPERITDPELIEFSRRVKVTADPEIDAAGDTARHLTRIAVFLHDGRVLRDERRHASGSAASPLPADAVERKFFKLARTAVPDDAAKRIRDLVATIDDLPDLADFASALAG